MSVFETITNKNIDISSYSMVALSYIGDSVYENILRSIVISLGNQKVEKLHNIVSSFSNASYQSHLSDLIIDQLTEEELDIFKRGRNASKHSKAKHQSIADYKKSTGFEALIGWLYLKGLDNRILELIKDEIVNELSSK